jgi:hypothetical protein
MLLVDECSRSQIEEIVAHLIENREFKRVFRVCEVIDLEE